MPAPRTNPMMTSADSSTAAGPPPPVTAHALEAAGGADLSVPAIEAVAGHALVAEREVELHRVVAVDRRQATCDLLGHPPVAGSAAREADRAADVLDVGVDRHHEARRRDRRPEAEVRWLPPDHPAQIQIEPLARAAERRQREQVAVAAGDAPAREDLAEVGVEEGAGEPLERRADRTGRRGVAGQEALLEGPEPRGEVARRDAERHEVARAVEAIPEVAERCGVAPRVEPGHERRRRRPHASEHPLELVAEEIDAPVREACGEETHQLAIARSGVAKGESDGVELDSGGVVELAIEPLERLP